VHVLVDVIGFFHRMRHHYASSGLTVIIGRPGRKSVTGTKLALLKRPKVGVLLRILELVTDFSRPLRFFFTEHCLNRRKILSQSGPDRTPQ
jgi:hypothetical protein